MSEGLDDTNLSYLPPVSRRSTPSTRHNTVTPTRNKTMPPPAPVDRTPPLLAQESRPPPVIFDAEAGGIVY